MPTINVDLDKKCKRCGKGGATQNGYCLACTVKNLKEGKYEHLLKTLRQEVEEAEGKKIEKEGPLGYE